MFHPWTEDDARSEISGEGMRLLGGCCGSTETGAGLFSWQVQLLMSVGRLEELMGLGGWE